MLGAVLFDLDGTLIDTNGQHVRAWHAALRAHGYEVAPDRIAVEIGKGGDQLVPDVLGKSADERDGDALRAAHDREFSTLIADEGVATFPGARDLLDAIRARGLRLALATSSPGSLLEKVERASGTAWRSLFEVVTNADDAARSKPAPDIVAAAIAQLGVTPAMCAMIGDSPWDAKAAVRAGSVLLGVRCGGNDERALRHAGARAVYDGPAALLARIDEALRVASPGSIRLDQAALDALVGHALRAADAALAAGEAPIGCAIADGTGTLVATGYNRFVATGDRAAHGEIEALHAARGRLPPRDAILVCTLEPCVMCLGAAMEVAIDTVVYGLRSTADCGTGRVHPPEGPDNQMPRILGGIREAECRARFERWLALPDRDPSQRRFIRGLLA